MELGIFYQSCCQFSQRLDFFTVAVEEVLLTSALVLHLCKNQPMLTTQAKEVQHGIPCIPSLLAGITRLCCMLLCVVLWAAGDFAPSIDLLEFFSLLKSHFSHL